MLGPTLGDLRPAARALGPTLRQVRPFFADTTPVIQNQLRPFSRDVLPTVRDLRPAARDLAVATPRLTTSLGVVNQLLNELAYNPPGAEEGFLFWTAWANHDGASVFAQQDAHGAIRRGLVVTSCSSLALLQNIGLREPGARHARGPAEPAGDERGLPGVVRGAEHDAAGRDGARPAPPEGGRLMQKQAPSVGRVMVMAGFALSCFGLILFLWLAFGGPIPLQPKGYRFVVSFKEAGQLAQEADVRISGVSVGKVKTIDPDPQTGLSDATIEIDERYAPVPSDTRAMLRQKTLLGETYVELTPGSAAAPKLPEGGRLPAGQVAPTVELDEIFRAFDAPTRDAFRSWMDQLAVASEGRGADVNAALGELAPFAEDTNTLLRILNAQQPTVRRLVADTGTVFDALSERDGQLRRLIENSNRVFATTAARNRELADTFRVLPTFERESTLTVNRLAAFARTANPLVTQLRPAARQLSPTLQETAALAPDLKTLFENLDPLTDASERGLPALTRFNDELHPLLGETDEPLRQLNPILGFVGAYPQGAHRLLRQRRRLDAGDDRGRRGRGPLPAHDEPGEPGEPRRLSAADRDEPPEPVPVPGRVLGARVRAAAVRDAPLRRAGSRRS